MLPRRYGGATCCQNGDETAVSARLAHILGTRTAWTHRRRRRVLLPGLRRGPQLPAADRTAPLHRPRRAARAARRDRPRRRVRRLPPPLRHRRPRPPHHHALLGDAARRRPHRRPRRPRGRRHLLPYVPGDRCGRGARGRLHDCTEDQLSALVDALASDTGRSYGESYGPGLAIELHEALDPLAAHLAAAGRESILLQGARIALADGPYTPAEREVLATVGAALTICADDVTRLLAAAGTPS